MRYTQSLSALRYGTMTIDDLIERLKSKRMHARACHDRNMCSGGHCVATVIRVMRDIALLGPDLRDGLEIDSFKREVIAYCPDVRIPLAHELLHEDDCN